MKLLGIPKIFLIAIGHLHIPAHGLNFINHMKLYINRPNKKGEKEEDRKKREQGSAEAISGLKSHFRSLKCLKTGQNGPQKFPPPTTKAASTTGLGKIFFSKKGVE